MGNIRGGRKKHHYLFCILLVMYYLCTMKQAVAVLWALLMVSACAPSYQEEKEAARQERLKAWREDSAAMKVAVTPTLDCLPLYVAEQYGMFDSLGVDIRLKRFASHIDCDTAIERGRVEATVTDLARVARLVDRGMLLQTPIATDTYWQLITNRNSRISELKQLDNKIVAMTRHSATDMLTDHAVDSGKIADERVFRAQVNDLSVRLLMLKNNEIDALLLPEPQATEALLMNNKVVMDSRDMGWSLGVVAIREFEEGDTARHRQQQALLRAYDMACDTINELGVSHFAGIIEKECSVASATVDSIAGRKIAFRHAQEPRQEDVDRATKWYKQRKQQDYGF